MVIDADDTMSWSANTPLVSAAVIMQVDGDPMPEDFTVSARIDWKRPDGQQALQQELDVIENSPINFSVTTTGGDMAKSARVGDLRWFVETASGTVAGEKNIRFQIDCPDLYTGELADIQDAMLDKFGDITTLQQVQDAGYGENTHGNINIQGVGTSFITLGPLDVDAPGLIIFIEDGNNANPTNATLDEPLKFVGWGYPAPDILPERPTLGCVPYHEWFLHAAGWHTPDDGGMVVDPGGGPFGGDFQEAFGKAVENGANAVTSYHPQVWDLHFWVNEEGDVPRLSIWNDPGGNKIPDEGLLVADDTIFFYP